MASLSIIGLQRNTKVVWFLYVTAICVLLFINKATICISSDFTGSVAAVVSGYCSSCHCFRARGIVSVCSNVLTRDVAALARSHINGLQPFENTIEQTTKTMPLATKQ